jgi:N-acetyl-anhydromuramyl-L-alanine amidase AmpD
MFKYENTFEKTPNQGARIIAPEGIVFHHSAGSFSGSRSWILNPISKVSYHCLVDLNGNRVNFVQDNHNAYHAGQSQWKGRKFCNNFMLGIAVSGDTNLREISDREAESVAEWCVQKMEKYKIKIENFVRHADVSPGRKTDVDLRAYKKVKDLLIKSL